METYKELIKSLTPRFKQMGFIKQGVTFYLELGKNYGVVNFQKSRDSTKDMVKFTINFGVYSYVLGQILSGYEDLNKPDVDQCQWEARVGEFMPSSPDFWWKINNSDDLNSITLNVMETVQNIVIPEIKKRNNDDGLIYCWLNEYLAGTTEIGKFRYLTTLLKEKGDLNTLNKVVDAFMQKANGKPNEKIAIRHLKEIKYSI